MSDYATIILCQHYAIMLLALIILIIVYIIPIPISICNRWVSCAIWEKLGSEIGRG